MAAQSALAATVVADPSLFHLLLDAQVFRALTEELRLDFAAALRHVRDHLRLTEQSGTVWDLLEDAPGVVDFGRSRLWLTARMTLARALLVVGEPEQLELDEFAAGPGATGVCGGIRPECPGSGSRPLPGPGRRGILRG